MLRKDLSRYFKFGSLAKGWIYLFLFLLIHAGFSPVYSIISDKNTSIEGIELDFDEESSEESKKLSELDKEYFLEENNFHFNYSGGDSNYGSRNYDLLIYHPEKDSPPPKVS